MSQLTSHILDTTRGKPAAGVYVILLIEQEGHWKEMAGSRTDNNGRVTDILPKDQLLEPAVYKLRFLIGDYFNALNVETLYPYIEIIFRIKDHEHYHIPLLLNPYGYSTYRGS